MEFTHEEFIQTTQQKDKRIEELGLKQEELIQTTEQKAKRIEELELNQNDLQHNLQTKDRMIQNLESQHEEFIKNTELKLRMMKEMKGNACFEVIFPVCPGEPFYCRMSNTPLETMMVEHIKSCNYTKFSHLKLNTEVKVTFNAVYMMEESRDWFKIKIETFNHQQLSYIMHHSEEETKDVLYYSIKYLGDSNILKFGPVRCAPMGISLEDAVHNNFTTNFPNNFLLKDVKFTMYKA